MEFKYGHKTIPERCSVPRTVLDISGSMCKGFSTLGKKDQGGLLREESQYNKLLLAWAIAHGRAETPILIHENVRGFSSSYLAGKLEHFHYRHVSTIKTTGSDCGLHANSRKRVQLNFNYMQAFACFLHVSSTPSTKIEDITVERLNI